MASTIVLSFVRAAVEKSYSDFVGFISFLIYAPVERSREVIMYEIFKC